MTKICCGCKQAKDRSEFYKSSHRSDGLQTYCKVCARVSRTEWGRNNRDKVAVNRVYSRYRLRPEDVDSMLESQGGRCVLCPTLLDKSNSHIDHSHATGEVRGILCQRCNIEVGRYESIRDHAAIEVYVSR